MEENKKSPFLINMKIVLYVTYCFFQFLCYLQAENEHFEDHSEAPFFAQLASLLQNSDSNDYNLETSFKDHSEAFFSSQLGFWLLNRDLNDYNLETWMQDISSKLNAKKIHEIVIPGSHDSGAFSFSRKSPVVDLPKWFGNLRKLVKYLPGEGIVVKWSKTQSLSIADQLKNGVRYLDFRICQVKDVFYLYHGLRGPKLEDELSNIRTFLDINKGEIIILDLSHFYNVNVQKLILLINKYLGNLCVCLSEKNLPYKELVNANKRCFIFCDNKQFNNQSNLSLGKSDSKWVDKVKIDELESALSEWHKNKNHNSIWILQYVLTSNAKYIAKHLISSLERITKATHKNLPEFIKKFSNLNVVMFDFVNDTSCRTIIDQNLKDEK